jgi:ATP-dependent RNA helicase SUPV3L1/SUV3
LKYKLQTNYRNIDARTWTTYLSTFRRKLVKEPVNCFGRNEELLEFCNKLDALSKETEEAELVGKYDDIDKPEKPTLKKCKDFLFEVMMKDAEVELKDSINMYKRLLETSDLRSPNEWYPYARLIKRKIIYHGGPTNSGKTYQALQRLRHADSEAGGGLYCGPLRLLALEVYESLNKQGAYTNLLTGQEKKEVDFATHVSCTVEMVKIDKAYDVAVIDEIQMIANNERGWAWTRALLGLRAKEIHVCGGLEAAKVVQALAESVGDDFELIEYKRLSTLQINEESLKGDYANIQPGDCVVAFSKADIFSIRRQIETLTSHKCAMIYGQLPSETRSTQARLFNEEGTGYDVLVASDAIGMGLNLNIKRIVFHTTLKRMGKETTFLDPSSVKQIAGRAGRLSSAYKIGEVTAWQEIDLAYVRSVMSWEIPPITSAGIFPSVEQIDLYSTHLSNSVVSQPESENKFELDREMLADHSQNIVVDVNSIDITPSFPDPLYSTNSYNISSTNKYMSSIVPSDNARLSQLLERFIENSKTNESFFLCDHEPIILVSNWLHTIPLTLAERYDIVDDLDKCYMMVTIYILMNKIITRV